MAESISDRQVVAVLRPFVRAAGPMVDALREADPFGLIAAGPQDTSGIEPRRRDKLLAALRSVRVPGTDAWAAMDTAERTTWWVNRVGRFTSLLTAVPGLGGALADRLPIQDTLGAASQGLLLCAIAGEHGVTGTGDRVRLLAWVLFGREIDPALAEGRFAGHDEAAEDARTEELTEDLSAASKRHGKVTLKAAARTLWRLGRSLLAVTDELEKRPSGRFYHRAMGMLPVVGMVGDYLGERSGLKRVTQRAGVWLARTKAQ
ncbi:hypothetical protein [Prauserella muralis]|uniref:Uncharacterized protein n=1 Tax=Prauserella muralis TaxID=588067 RepID=A0A2V4APP4_9PSEU|nr:hypothetical protein [Prauserella muralis]PXY21096.1 hypothetical protein BAY60_26880 [Prauserella muralis]TWE30178.1 hypothetical protein FHX69_2875 [Prauserella muralis]